MAAIKRFFEKRKLDIKFKKAGGGHSLTSDGGLSSQSTSTSASLPSTSSPKHLPSSAEQKMAAEAALARINQQRTGNKPSAVKVQVRLDLEAEKKALEKAQATAAHYTGPREVVLDAAPVAGRVLYRCPLVNAQLRLPKEEMEKEIELFLLSQLTDEPSMAAALMMCTLNKNDEVVKHGIETIVKYLDNIAQHPTEEKYQRIRIANKIFQEKVVALQGAEEFMQAAGFVRSKVDGADEFLVFNASPEPEATSARCLELKEILNSAERIRPELDRDLRVFYPSPNAARISVPDEFYRVTRDELKREQQARTEAVEQFGMLRTKQMRERDRIRELRRYRFCLIRIRFPDGVILQGTFFASDNLSAVLGFIVDNLANEWMPFVLSTSMGVRVCDENSTLAELDLAPASMLTLEFDADVMSDVSAAQGGATNGPFLKPEIMAVISSL